MLLEYGISNFRSFKGESYIDLRPAKGKILKRYPTNYVEFSNGERTLKSAVIVGENAGGKTNFVRSVGCLKDLFSRSDTTPKSARRNIHFSALDDIDSQSEFQLSQTEQSYSFSALLDGVVYSYSLTVDVKGILHEGLSFRKKKGEEDSPIFETSIQYNRRCSSCDQVDDCANELNEVTGCRGYEVMYHRYEDSAFDVRLVDALNDTFEGADSLTIVKLATVGEPHCRRVLDWFTNDLIVAFATRSSKLERLESEGTLQKILKTRDYLEILRLIDGSIIGFEVDDKEPFRESVIVRHSESGDEYRLKAREDSVGVAWFLYWSFYIYEVVYEGKTVIADEIDSFINPILSEKVVAFINGSEHRGQFIFTTHNIFNLTLRTYMKEQINFVTKDPMTLESCMYSLADFEEIRYDKKEELYEFYMKGVFGGTVYA